MLRKYSGYFLAALLGLSIAFVVAGPFILDPTNIAWLQSGDPATHNLGWVFFRFDEWRFPLGLNPHYGLGIGSSVVYSDSIPFAAIVFKLFHQVLPSQFQYLGIWTYLCLVFHAMIAWALMGLISNQSLLRFLGVALLTFSPAMLWRIGEHTALVTHFLILAALFLNLATINPNTKKWFWYSCLILATLTQFYLLVAVLILWLADSAHDFANSNLTKSRALINLMLGILLVLSSAWLVGYFVVGIGTTVATGNYGIGKLNLLAIVNPQGWSYLIPDVPINIGNKDLSDKILFYQEGYNYLGLGLLICFVVCLFALCKNKTRIAQHVKQYQILLIALLLMTIFSISNVVSFGPYSFTIPLPESMTTFASILRASARMFWPTYYILIFFILYVIINTFSTKVAAAILFIGLIIQIADTSAGWTEWRKKLMQPKTSEWAIPLKNTFWNDASSRYREILVVPLRNVQAQAHWEELSAYAAKHKMATNAVYLARFDYQQLRMENIEFDDLIRKGSYKDKVLYVMEDEKIIPVLISLDTNKDVFAKINGLNILAPGWAACKTCAPFDENTLIKREIPKVNINEEIIFNKSNKNSNFLIGIGQREITGWGWSYPEEWGTWIDGRMGRLVLPLPKEYPTVLDLKMRSFAHDNVDQQVFELWVNDSYVKKVVLPKLGDASVKINLAEIKDQKNYLVIDFKNVNPTKPKDLGMGNDDRLLSIGLVSATFH